MANLHLIVPTTASFHRKTVIALMCSGCLNTNNRLFWNPCLRAYYLDRLPMNFWKNERMTNLGVRVMGAGGAVHNRSSGWEVITPSILQNEGGQVGVGTFRKLDVAPVALLPTRSYGTVIQGHYSSSLLLWLQKIGNCSGHFENCVGRCGLGRWWQANRCHTHNSIDRCQLQADSRQAPTHFVDHESPNSIHQGWRRIRPNDFNNNSSSSTLITVSYFPDSSIQATLLLLLRRRRRR